MKKNKTEKQLSDQALGAIMMALQKSLLEQSDIVPTLKDMRFKESNEGLVVMNPPMVKYEYGDEEEPPSTEETVAASTE
tara:strand:+ start:15360 stop:15596 length:237 start_codon:yes stop_codon:yes gene_type:complete